MKFKNKWKKMLVLLCAAALLAVNIKSFADEAESRRFSILSVSGNEAFLTRGANEVKAAAGIPVGQGNSIRTGAKTKLYLETDDSKTIRLDSSSSAEITKSSAKLLKITLKSGSLFFNVDKPLKDDEEMSFDAAQTSMSIRGTSGIIRITEEELVLELIEGNISWNLGSKTITVDPGQKVVLKAVAGTDNYQLETVEHFTWEDLEYFELETVLEQLDLLDVSAIELIEPGFVTAALEKLTNLHIQETGEKPANNSRVIKMDGADTTVRRNRGRNNTQNSAAQTSASTESTTEEATESTEESTVESTETEPTTEETTVESTTTEPPDEEGDPGEENPGEVEEPDNSDSSPPGSSPNESSGETQWESSNETESSDSSSVRNVLFATP